MACESREWYELRERRRCPRITRKDTKVARVKRERRWPWESEEIVPFRPFDFSCYSVYFVDPIAFVGAFSLHDL